MTQITVLVMGTPTDRQREMLPEQLGPEVRVASAANAAGFRAADLAAGRVLFVWSGSPEDVASVMKAAPLLEWIHVRFAGLDRVLFPELIESPIPLTNGKGVFSQSLGEFVMLGVLYFAKDVPRMWRAKAERRWDVFDVREARSETIGIVGHGDIGRAVARRAKAFGMRVLALRRNTAARAGDEDVDRIYGSAELHAMLAECDYVAVTAPLTPDTEGLMGPAEFAAMKPTAIIMNVGRGPVINEAAMIEALRNKQIAGAWLDVFEAEPLPSDSPLWGMDNVFLSPHCADNTRDWLDDAVRFFAGQFGRWKRGEPLKNIVDKQAGY